MFFRRSSPPQPRSAAGEEKGPFDKVVAVALLDDNELRNVSMSIKRIYPIEQDSSFDALLIQIDRAARRR